jgi:hypothetical protein
MYNSQTWNTAFENMAGKFKYLHKHRKNKKFILRAHSIQGLHHIPRKLPSGSKYFHFLFAILHL